MNTKTVAIIAIFAALGIVLNVSPLKIPAPYAPFLIYQIWEIPIVIAFLLYGARVGVLITVINTIALLALFPGALLSGPFYNMAAVLSMLLGIGMTKILVERHSPKNDATIATLYTASGVALRTIVMTVVNYAFQRYPPPIGFSLAEDAIIATMPLIVIFNITLALYTIPISYALAKAMKSYIKT